MKPNIIEVTLPIYIPNTSINVSHFSQDNSLSAGTSGPAESM